MQADLTYHTPTVESISELVHAFYADVRQDALLGPVFDEALNGQWDEHTARLFAPEVAHGLQAAAHGVARNLFRGYFGELPGFATPRQEAHPHGA